MKIIRFGIIGFGRQGLRLAEHIRKDVRNGKLSAVCRRSDSGHSYAKKHGVKYYFNYHDLLKDKEIDAVVITTPNSLHGIQALEALKHKKHVLIDKPIASTIAEGRKILSAAKKNRLIAAVNFPLRVNPVTKALKTHMKAIGRIKKIHVVVSYGPVMNKWQCDIGLSNGGVILDLGSHYFDLITCLTGNRPQMINSAYSEKKHNENSGYIDMKYKDFSVSMVLLRNQRSKKYLMTLAGDKGLLSADYTDRSIIVSNTRGVKTIKYPAGHDCMAMLNNMAKAVNNKEKIVADADAGLLSLNTALSVYKAIKTRKPVRL